MNIKGFTLIELVMSLAVTSILTAMAAPSFSHFYNDNIANNKIKELHRALHLARETAVETGHFVIICSTNGDLNCDRNKKEQLLIFIDKNKNYYFDKDDIILSQHHSKIKAGIVRWNNSRPLRYRPDGSVSFAGSLIYCPSNIENKKLIKRLTINRNGRVYQARKNKLGLILSASNKVINCKT